MATLAQIKANRANAQRSTGPRTDDGKACSARNAARHSLTSRTLVVADDERAEFDQFLSGLHAEIAPYGVLEQEYFDQAVLAAWNLRRISRLEAELISPDDANLDPLQVDANLKKLQLYELYRSRAERSFHKALAELRRIQEDRFFRAARLRDHIRRSGSSPQPNKRNKGGLGIVQQPLRPRCATVCQRGCPAYGA